MILKMKIKWIKLVYIYWDDIDKGFYIKIPWISLK